MLIIDMGHVAFLAVVKQFPAYMPVSSIHFSTSPCPLLFVSVRIIVSIGDCILTCSFYTSGQYVLKIFTRVLGLIIALYLLI